MVATLLRRYARELGEPNCMGAEFDEARDATRRTRLANERTYLAWWRTGLTALAVCVGVGRIVPGVSEVTKWPFEVVGAVGIGFILVAYRRHRAVEDALDRGGYTSLDDRVALGLTIAGIALGLAT